jgi:hypothetical protein
MGDPRVDGDRVTPAADEPGASRVRTWPTSVAANGERRPVVTWAWAYRLEPGGYVTGRAPTEEGARQRGEASKHHRVSKLRSERRRAQR